MVRRTPLYFLIPRFRVVISLTQFLRFREGVFFSKRCEGNQRAGGHRTLEMRARVAGVFKNEKWHVRSHPAVMETLGALAKPFWVHSRSIEKGPVALKCEKTWECSRNDGLSQQRWSRTGGGVRLLLGTCGGMACPNVVSTE